MENDSGQVVPRYPGNRANERW